jgi:hypothetical protein
MGFTEDNLYQIWNLTPNTTFADWVSHYNTLVVEKLNRMTVYNGASGDGIVFTLGTTASNDPLGGATSGPDLSAGVFRCSIADVIPKGITFSENVNVDGDITISGDFNYDLSNTELSAIKTFVRPLGGFTATKGLTFGMPVRVVSNGGDADYQLSRADDSHYAEVFGVVSGVTWPSVGGVPSSPYTSSNTYATITTHGKIEGDFTRSTDFDAGLSAGCVYFLSPGNSGGLTRIEPTISGHISKPVLLGITSDVGYVVQYRGQLLQGSGTGGTGGIDNNRFIVSIDPGTDILRGDVVGYNGADWIKINSESDDLGSAVGLCITSPFVLDGQTYIQVVGTGYINDMPVGDGSGLLYVGSDGKLTSNGAQSQAKPFAIAWPSGDGNDGFIINQTHNAGGGSSTSTNTASSTRSAGGAQNWAYRSTSSGGTTYGHAMNDNIIINGNFDIWQRGIGVGTHGATGTTYFADRWVRVDGVSGGGGTAGTYSITRNNFTDNQTDVFGEPRYYVTLQNDTHPQGGLSGDYVYVENRVEDVRTLRGENATMSFWAKCGVTGATMGLVINQYDGTNTHTTHPANVQLGTLWSKYEVAFLVPNITTAPTGNKDYIGFGFNTTGLNTTLDLAKVKVERGLVATTNPKTMVNDELKLCSRYYQRSYREDQSTHTETMLDPQTPDTNVIDFHITPSKDHYYTFPVLMRGEPSVTLYSPKTGMTGDAFNRTSGRDLRKSSGTKGYADAARISSAGATTIKTEYRTKDGIYLYVPMGTVIYDNVSVHYVANADLDENMPNT